MRYMFVLFWLICSCTSEPEAIIKDVNWTKNNSTDLNKNLVIQEGIDIKLFLEMHKDWIMTETGTGLQYYIYEHGTVDSTYSPVKGNLAELEYEIALMDGTICDKTEADEYVELKVDNSDIESGVQEAVKLLSIGDRAKLIIPSHIGHGLVGDLDKIPPLTTLVLDIHLIGIK
ncbi:MAG: FKBP-type peptidyl-prolyl cis-trans isomerase [Flavobacteriales bacterium]|nr:FKBP-type peptidyl-prolyl cis-trans isomerase [Flavobacteriales bacterium]